MDGLLFTTTAAVLVDVEFTTHSVNKCINAIPSAQRELGPVLVELQNLRDRLEQFQNEQSPRALQSSLIGMINGYSCICKRLGEILAGCAEDADPERCWALVSDSTEIPQLGMVLEQGRRALDIVNQALDSDYYDGLLTDINDLRHVLESETSPIYASIVSCLDVLEDCVASIESSRPCPGSPVSPSLQEMVMSFRRSSLQDWEARDSKVCGMEEFDGLKDSIAPRSSYLPRNAIEDEDQVDKSTSKRPGQLAFEYQDLRPPPLRLNQRNLIGEARPAPIYKLFPPAVPPPVKALPPIPPARSPRRPVTNPAPSVSTPVGSSPQAASSSQARKRAQSDLTQETKFSSSSPAVDRFSGLSRGSVVPPRSSSHSYQAGHLSVSMPDTISESSTVDLEIVPLQRLEINEKEDVHGCVYSIDTHTKSAILASRNGKFHIRLWDLQSGTLLATLKVSCYVQVQPRSRDFFVRSHAILSETLNLVAITTGFGQTIEIWNWSKRKKIQTINDAPRWAAVRSDVYESRFNPLATYSEDDNAIKVYPITPAKKPFGKPRIIDLRKAGLPHLPKLPELAFSATGPLLVAAAGPRPPRPGNPPPVHAALLMAWQLDGDERIHKAYKYLETTTHPEIENSLPLHLETYGSVAVSIWEPAKFRTIGRPGTWQVEPVKVTERVVLVWDFSGPVNKTTTYPIPAVLACISPDCRFVAYCDPGGLNDGNTNGTLVVLDATRGGRELWRLNASESGLDPTLADLNGRDSWWSRKSSDTRRSGQKSDKSSEIVDVEGLELLAANLKRVTELAFSSDGSRLLVGDENGRIGTYKFRFEEHQIALAM